MVHVIRFATLLCVHTSLLSVLSEDIGVATYSLWNQMFYWDVRKYYIAELISNAKADIIAFQDVLSNENHSYTEIDDLRKLLPDYSYTFYAPEKLYRENTRSTSLVQWKWEGLGIMSRLKLLTSNVLNLTNNEGNDFGFSLHCKFSTSSAGVINMLVVHFPDEHAEQCRYAANLLQYLYEVGVENMIILGNFNADDDFWWPVQALLTGYFKSEAPKLCLQHGRVFVGQQFRGYGYAFRDAWSELYPNRPGFTFSNLPHTGLVSRPDRILVSRVGLKVNSAALLGKGVFYAHRFRNSLWWSRLGTIHQAAKENWLGLTNAGDCLWDCGGTGYCRCGVCVTGIPIDKCVGGDCDECSHRRLILVYAVSVLMVAGCSYLLALAVVLGLRLRGQVICRPRIVRKLTHRYLACAVGVATVCLFRIQHDLLARVFHTAYDQMKEELRPSDHLMVSASVKVVG